MSMPSFKSLSSLLLAGALSLQLAGCGTQDQFEEDDVVTESGALTRVGAVRGADAVAETQVAARPANANLTATVTAAPAEITPAAPAGGGATTGTTDLERNHPWVVRISETGGLSCRGTLIHPLWVLTAAHCMGPFAGKVNYSRTLPDGTVVSGSQSFNVTGAQRGMFPHPEFEADTGFGLP